MALSDLLVKVGIDSSAFRSGISDLRSQSASLRASMAQMAGTIRDQVKELNAMARAGKTGTDEFKKLEQQIKGNEAAFKGMGKEAKYLDKQLKGMEGPKLGGLLGQMGQAVTGGIIGGGVAQGAMAAFTQVQQAISGAITTSVDFDDQLRKIAATSGASAQEMGMLRDAAIEWGAKTSFSASESAQAMQYMAQAGWSTRQTIEGLPGVLNLAASSGEDLGTVAEIVTNNLNAFKLQASDAGRFADVLATAAAASSTDVGNMGVTFKYVAPLAGALGFSIEDTAIAIGLMANNGIKGSQAGTGLAAILANMSKPTAEMQREMTKLNVSLVDSAGKVKPLRQLIGELRDSFKTLTPAQQLSSATAIAGKEAMSELLAIVTSTDDAFASMTKQIDNNTGVSKRMADTMEGGVGGALRRLSGSWESLTLVMTGSGSLLESFANIMADVVGGLAAFAKGNIDVAKAGEEAKMAVMQEQAEMNTLLNVLKTTNAGTDQRKQLIEELNSKYGAYLGNLIDEKTSIQDITKAQNQANAAFRERIKLAASEAMMTAALQKRIELEGRLIETELKIERLQQQRTTAMKDPAALQGLDYALKAAKNTQAELNKEIAASNQQINELEKVAGKATASASGLNNAIQNNTKVLNLNTDNGIQEHIKALKEEQGNLERGSVRYREITAEIARYEKMMQKAGTTKAKVKGPDVRVVSNLMGADQSAMFDLTDKMRKQLEEANILQGIFGNINLIDEEIKALGEVIKGGIESAIDPTILQPFIDRLKELEKMKLGPQINVDEQSLQMGNMMADMAKKISEDRKLAEAFGMQFDSMATEANALAEFIRQGIETNMSEELLRPVIDRWSELNAEINKQGFAVGIIEQVGSVAMSTFEAIGAGSTSAAQGFAAVGKAALMASLDFLKGKLLESTGGLMKWASSLGPFGIPIATAGVGALFALVKGAIGRTKGVQLAEGGIISGRTMAEVGEYPGAAFNPEVVAPLDKLQAMLDIGGSTHVTGTFRVQGADLVLALDNAQRKMNQFRV